MAKKEKPQIVSLNFVVNLELNEEIQKALSSKKIDFDSVYLEADEHSLEIVTNLGIFEVPNYETISIEVIREDGSSETY